MAKTDYRQVNLHPETVELVDAIRPDEYISRSQWVDGTMWRFYGHMLHGDRRGNRLTARERVAIAVLIEDGDVDPDLLTKAFDVSRQQVDSVWRTYRQKISDDTNIP